MKIRISTSAIFTLLILMGQATSPLTAHGQSVPSFIPLDPSNAQSFEGIPSPAAINLKEYFNALAVGGFSDGLFFSHSTLGFSPFHFSRLIANSKKQNCPAIFCHDSELFQRLQRELQSKRLVLITHAFNPFNGVALNNTPAVLDMKSRFVDVDNSKNAIIISPNLNLYSFEHELVHTRDFENGAFNSFNTFLSDQIKAGKISRIAGIAARNLVREVRAYDVERKLLETQVRQTEYALDLAKVRSTMDIEVIEVRGSDFASSQLQAIETEVLSNLVGRLRASLQSYDEETKNLLFQQFADLLPSEGPYSLVGLFPERRKL